MRTIPGIGLFQPDAIRSSLGTNVTRTKALSTVYEYQAVPRQVPLKQQKQTYLLRHALGSGEILQFVHLFLGEQRGDARPTAFSCTRKSKESPFAQNRGGGPALNSAKQSARISKVHPDARE